MDLKDILNNVLGQSGFLQRSSFTSSGDPDDVQMVAIANRAAIEIANYYNWSELRTASTINLITGTTLYDLPSDFKDMVPGSLWELDGERPVEYAVPDGRWYMYKFSTWSDGGTIRVRRYGSQLEVHDPETDSGFQFEYVSKYAVRATAGTPKEFFTLDTDTWALDDQVLVLGIQAHWMQTKLMPQYVEMFANYNRKMTEAIGRSFGGRTIGGINSSLAGDRSPYYPLYRPSS